MKLIQELKENKQQKENLCQMMDILMEEHLHNMVIDYLIMLLCYYVIMLLCYTFLYFLYMLIIINFT